MNISTSIKLDYAVQETLDAGLAANVAVPFATTDETQLTAGVSNNQADLHWEKRGVVLAAGASVTYTLSALADDLGRTVALVKVRAIVVIVTARTAGDYLTVGNAGSNPWTAPMSGTSPTFKVYKMYASVMDKTDGLAVTAGSADQLKFTNSGSNALTFTVAFVGTSS